MQDYIPDKAAELVVDFELYQFYFVNCFMIDKKI